MAIQIEEFFDKIAGIFKKSLEEKGSKENPRITTIEFKGFTIDLPRKEAQSYHGSSFDILCNHPTRSWCKIKGDIVTHPDSEYTVNKMLEESGCKIFSTHSHIQRKKEGQIPLDLQEESHIHFICEDKDRDDTIRMIKLLKNY